jgi:hypothetical protein
MLKLPVVNNISEESRRNLVLVRLIYGKALQAANDSGILGGMLALIECDLALELLLKTLLREAQGGLVEFEKWDDLKSNLVAAAKAAGQYQIIDLTQVMHWHRQRNAVQHLGTPLPKETLNKALVDYERAFSKIYDKLFGRNFAATVEADLLDASRVRDWLVSAGEAWGRGDLQTCFNLAVQSYFFVILSGLERKIHCPYSELIPMDQDKVGRETRWLWTLYVRLQIRELGVPPEDYAWMVDIDNRLGPDRHYMDNSSLTASEVRRALDIAIETAVHLGTEDPPRRELKPIYDVQERGPELPLSGAIVSSNKFYCYGFCSTQELREFEHWLYWKKSRSILLTAQRFGGGWCQFVIGPNPQFDWETAFAELETRKQRTDE